MWWAYGDPNDPEVGADIRERRRQLEEQARDELADRVCIRCKVSAGEDAKHEEQRQKNPSRFHGVHRVFEPVD